MALVTGASRGLGKSIAERLAAEGAVVAITARTLDPDPKYVGSLRETCDGIIAAGGEAIAVQADLSNAEDRERMWAEVTKEVGTPDILVNNAAVTFLRPLDGFPDKRARLMLEMHVMAPLHLTQLAIPAMRERRRGWVVMLVSLAGERISGPPFSAFDTSAGFGMYGTCKAALGRMAIKPGRQHFRTIISHCQPIRTRTPTLIAVRPINRAKSLRERTKGLRLLINPHSTI